MVVLLLFEEEDFWGDVRIRERLLIRPLPSLLVDLRFEGDVVMSVGAGVLAFRLTVEAVVVAGDLLSIAETLLLIALICVEIARNSSPTVLSRTFWIISLRLRTTSSQSPLTFSPFFSACFQVFGKKPFIFEYLSLRGSNFEVTKVLPIPNWISKNKSKMG